MEKIKWFSTTAGSYWKQMDHPAEATADRGTDLRAAGQTDQTFDGFGTCFNELGEIALRKLPEADHEHLLDLLFAPDADGLRLSYCRMPMGANDYAEGWYSYNETEGDYAMEHFSIDGDRKYLLPYIKDAYKRNGAIRMFASPWSPPTWMKFPKAYNNGTLIMDPENLRAYALYFAKFAEAYEKEGIHIDGVHIQNEPFADQKFPSCLWTGEQFIEFIGKYIGPLFAERGLSTKIFLGTLNSGDMSAYNAYVNALLHDPDASKYTAGVGLQWASKAFVPLMHESWPEIYTVQTENECGNAKNTWESAVEVYGLFRHYITYGVRAYVYWNAVLEEGGTSTWGWHQNSMITVRNGEYTLNPEYYIMKHYSRFVQPGAVRLVLSGHWTSVSTAFRNPDGSTVLVTQNPFKKTQTLRFDLDGKSYAFDLPADSINTIVL